MGKLQAWANRVHKTAKTGGFWYYDSIGPDQILAKLALIVSEVSEILEAYRKQHGADKIAEEFADTFIRLADLYKAMQVEGLIVTSFDEAVMRKADKNDGRPYMHGNLI